MRHTDWAAYLDGSMPAAEREALSDRLSREPGLQRSLDGYKAFIQAIRDQAHSVNAPVAVLESALKTAVAKPKRSRLSRQPRWVMAALPAIALGLVYCGFTYLRPTESGGIPNLTVAEGATLETKPESDPEGAVRWLQEKTGIAATPFTFKDRAKMVAVKYGKDWGGFDYQINKDTVHMLVSGHDNFDGAPIKRLGGYTFYFGMRGYGWRSGGLSYYVEGCGTQLLSEIALAARQQQGTPVWEPGAGAPSKPN
jgi:hypothetical protein